MSTLKDIHSSRFILKVSKNRIAFMTDDNYKQYKLGVKPFKSVCSFSVSDLLHFKTTLAFRYKMRCKGKQCEKCDYKFLCEFILDEEDCL